MLAKWWQPPRLRVQLLPRHRHSGSKTPPKTTLALDSRPKLELSPFRLHWILHTVKSPATSKVEMTISVSDPYPHHIHPYSPQRTPIFTTKITHIHHKEHPKLAIVIISCQRGNLCAEIAIGGETKIVIRWVYITEIVIYGILLWNYRKYSIPYKKILKK
jgi:hypothetical protein